MKISGSLPKGDRNGLEGLDPYIVTMPQRRHVVIAVLATKSVVSDVDTGYDEAHLRIERIERVLSQDADEAELMLRRALERRSGKQVLPLDIEDDITAIFMDAQLDLEIGATDDEEGTDA